jgi:hypothetical protein
MFLYLAHRPIMINGRQNSVIPISALLLMGGCKLIRPSRVTKVHCGPNNAIAKTNDEQLLLNIVRLKCHDSSDFIEVNHLSEIHRLTTRIGPNGSEIGRISNARQHELVMAYNQIIQSPTMITPS